MALPEIRKQKEIFIIFCFLLAIACLPFEAIADDQNRPIGAAPGGMANAYVTQYNCWSLFHNQAGIAFLERPVIAAGFSNSFMLKELSTRSVGGALPFKFGTIGATYSYYGFELYNESKASLSFAKRLSPILALGISLDYFQIGMSSEYGSKGTVAGEIGLIAEPIENFNIGVHLFNPWRAKIADYDDERLPTVMRLGFSYLFSGKLLLAVEGEKDMNMDAIFKAGIQYELVKGVYLRTGISNKPSLLSFGAGFRFKSISADLSFSKHPVLDYSTKAGLVYHF